MSECDIGKLMGSSVLLGDGSTGSALQALGPRRTDRLALLPLEEPELVGRLHAAYFAAGSDVAETATFTANARSLGSLAARSPAPANSPAAGLDLAELAYRVNRAGAELAVLAAHRAGSMRRDADSMRRAAEPGEGGRARRRRWVAGSIGPGEELPSLGSSSWAELRSSYLPQARGLADGGVDFAMVETCQDPLQIKAALAALADPEGGRGLPFVVSATVDSRGRLLSGTSIPALVAIVAPFGPLAIGLNCSGGPEELEGPLAELAALSPFPLSYMPNAGLPIMSEGKAIYALGPEAFARHVAAQAIRHGVALVGGCCGTTPEHIAALGRALGLGPTEGPPPPLARPGYRPSLASLYEARPFGRLAVGLVERADPAGAYEKALAEGDAEALADLAVSLEEKGAALLRLRVARSRGNEAAVLAALVAAASPRARSPLCLEAEDAEALAAALPFVGGRALVLVRDDAPAETKRRAKGLAALHGAAIAFPSPRWADSCDGAVFDYEFEPVC